jgi:hypothetical protein
VIGKAFGKKAWAVHGCLNGMLGSGQTERGETGEEQSRESMLIICFKIKGIDCSQRICSGRPNSQFRILLWCFMATTWKFAPKFWRQKNWLLHHDSAPSHTSFFTREFLTKRYMTVVPHPPYFSLFPRLKIKLKDRHFDTTEVIEAESQAVLNTLTEHDFQDAFKKWQKLWERCIWVGRV